MDIINAFVLDGTSHEVRILWEDGEPLLCAADLAKVLDLANVHSSLDSMVESEDKVFRMTPTTAGDKRMVFVTEIGAYTLIMRSRKPVAARFQRWVANVIKTIRKTGGYQLKTLEDQNEGLRNDVEVLQAAIAATARQHTLDMQQVTHNALVASYKGQPVVYFGKIREDGDQTLIKIGSTKDLETRVQSLELEFGAMSIFHVIPCPQHKSFEDFLQNHSMVKPMVFKAPIHQGRRSNGEVFRVTPEDITVILNVAKRNRFRFVDEVARAEVKEQLEIELAIENAKLEAARLTQEAQVAEQQRPIVVIADTRRYTQSRGTKIQRYTPDGKTLLETYPGCAEAARDSKLNAPVAASIRLAIADKTVYKGYRWAALDRAKPDDTIQDIGPTSDAKTTRQGFVAMLNLTQTQIVKVFCDQKAAAEDRQFKGVAAISNAIKRGSKSGGHMFRMWYDCEEELKDAYLLSNELPQPRVRANSKPVEQINPLTGEVVKRFSSIEHIKTAMRVARQSLNTAIEFKHVLKGYKWRYVDDEHDDAAAQDTDAE